MIIGRKPKLSPAQQAELHAWAAYGTSKAQVRRRLRISASTIDRYLKLRHKAPVR